MISQIIEARPEDLRVYLEEAAGISKYKERRKETETRIRHTRENLDRLNDLREEVGKQLEHLKRQARAGRAVPGDPGRAPDQGRRVEGAGIPRPRRASCRRCARSSTQRGNPPAAADRRAARSRARRSRPAACAARKPREALNKAQAEVYQVGGDAGPHRAADRSTSARWRSACSARATRRRTQLAESARTSAATRRSWTCCATRSPKPSRSWTQLQRRRRSAPGRPARRRSQARRLAAALGRAHAARSPKPRAPATSNAPASNTSTARRSTPTAAASS